MVDSGVRIAAAFLPAGVPVVVGIVLAILRRRVMPRVSLPAIIGLALQLVILLISAFLVGFLGLLPARGWSPDGIRTLSSVLGFVVIVLQLVSWTLILVALFTRLPAKALDRTPTGRHALVDESGEQVVAEEGTTLLPVAAGLAGAGAGGAAAASSTDAPVWETPPLQPAGPPRTGGPDDEPADTEMFAATPGAEHPSSFPAPGTTANPDEPTTAVTERAGPDGAPAGPVVAGAAADEDTPTTVSDDEPDDLQPDAVEPEDAEADDAEPDAAEPEATDAVSGEADPAEAEAAGPPSDEDDPSDDIPADDVAPDPAADADPVDEEDVPATATGDADVEATDTADTTPASSSEPVVAGTPATPDSPVADDTAVEVDETDDAVSDADGHDPPDVTSSGTATTATPTTGSPIAGSSTTGPSTSTPPATTPPIPAAPSSAPRTPASSGTTGGAHPWFTPTGTGNPVTPAPTADEDAPEDADAPGAHPTEARPAGSSEHS